MLKRTCQEFRERFEPRSEHVDQHLSTCPDCEAWVQQFPLPAPLPPAPLPRALAQRLQAIPQQVVLCRDVERLYAETRRRAAASRQAEEHGEGEKAADFAAAAHLAECSRCQLLYGTLESVLLEPPQPLPQRLRPRLAKLAAQPSRKPPRWLQDARYAAAACFLLACSLTLVVDEAAATFQEVRGSVQATTSSLARTVRTTAEEAPRLGIFEEVSASLEKNYLGSRQRISSWHSSWRTWTHETLRELETQRQRLSQKYQIQKGAHDG